MTTGKQRAFCAKFMGWTWGMVDSSFGHDSDSEILPAWVDNQGDLVCWVKDYRPESNTPEGREQANKLIMELVKRKIYPEIYVGARESLCELYSDKWRDPFRAQGLFWNAALTEAVAELQMEREKNG